MLHRRLTRTELVKQYPAVDFSSVPTEDDPTWTPDQREPSENVFGRVYAFLLWLRQSEQDAAAAATTGSSGDGTGDVGNSSGGGSGSDRHIMVVSHSAWLLHLFNGVLDCAEADMHEWFRTGELRSVVLTFPGEEGAAEGVAAATAMGQPPAL